MPRPANEAAEAACRDPANHGLPTADLARLTGISHRTLSDVRGRLVERGEIPQPPSGRGHHGDRVIPWRVTADEYQALADYADRLGCEIADAIHDNLLGQCAECSEPAILDARPRPLCERHRDAGDLRPADHDP